MAYVEYDLMITCAGGEPESYGIMFQNPMDAMNYWVDQTIDQSGYGNVTKVECYRYEGETEAHTECKERQWLIQID